MTGAVLRVPALLACLLVALSGCTAATARPPGASGQVGGPATVAAGPATSVPTPQPEDLGFADVVTGAGFDSGTAAFAALTTSTLEVADGHTFVVRQAFANGATATTAYHLFAGGRSPGEAPILTFARSDTAFRYTVEYGLATAELPADLRAQVLAGLPGTAPGREARDAAVAALGVPAGGVRLPADDSPSTIGVVVDGVISQAKESGIDAVAETTGLDRTHAGTSWEAYKAGKKVWDALEANGVVADALGRIRAARKCAANPTNELTRKQYEQNPGAKQELLRRLDDISDEVTGNAAALFVQLFTDAGAGLVKAAPWLGFITSPATEYIKANLTEAIDGRVREAEQLVPKCRPTRYKVTGDRQLTVNTTIEAITAPFTVNAAGDGFRVSFTFTPGDGTGRHGRVEYEGAGNGFTMSGSGSYTVSGDAPGPYRLTHTAHGCVDIGDCATNTHTWPLTPVTGS